MLTDSTDANCSLQSHSLKWSKLFTTNANDYVPMVKIDTHLTSPAFCDPTFRGEVVATRNSAFAVGDTSFTECLYSHWVLLF